MPLIAGWDSAYAHVGRPGYDYLRIGCEAELLEAIALLAGDEGFYRRIVAEGKRHAPQLSQEAIAQVWIEALEGPVATAFERWREHGPANAKVIFGRGADRLRGAASAMKSMLLGWAG